MERCKQMRNEADKMIPLRNFKPTLHIVVCQKISIKIILGVTSFFFCFLSFPFDLKTHWHAPERTKLVQCCVLMFDTVSALLH